MLEMYDKIAIAKQSPMEKLLMIIQKLSTVCEICAHFTFICFYLFRGYEFMEKLQLKTQPKYEITDQIKLK